jgi:hypothetical protein
MPEHAVARPFVDYMLVAVCPVCGGQANYLKLGRAECDGFNGTQHPGPVSCELVKVMPWDGTLAADREQGEPAAAQGQKDPSDG